MTRAVLFDWDGTLVDSAEASFRCYVRTFESFGIPFDRDTYARTYSPNWYLTLKQREIAAGIVTSGGRERVTRELAHHGLAGHVREAVFGCDVANKKPHPEGLLLCLERLGIGASEAIYVGDSPEDIRMAKAAGVYSIAVPGGYPNRAALEAARPDVMVESLRDIRL